MATEPTDFSVPGSRATSVASEAHRERDALYVLADRLQQAQTHEDIYGAALDAILSALPCDRASILLLDSAGTMRFVAWRDLSPEYRAAVEGHSPWRADEKHPTPVCVADVEAAQLSADIKQAVRAAGIRAAWFIPIVAGGKLIGKFMTYFDAPRAASDAEVALSLTIARHLGISIERERTQEALRLSEQRFRAMIDALPAVIYTTDAQGRLTHFNPAAVEFSGRVPQLGTDQWCVTWKLYLPDGKPLPHAECPMAVALQAGHAAHGSEVMAERPDGSRRWFAAYPTSLRNANGQVTGGINMLIDTTERKRAEEDLASELESMRRLQALSTELIRSGDVTLLYEQIVDVAVVLMRADFAILQVIDPDDQQRLRLLTHRGLGAESASLWKWVGTDSGSVCSNALRERRRVVINDVANASGIIGAASLEAMMRTGIRAAQATPLVSRDGKIVGMVSTQWRRSHEPAMRELRLLDILARQAADLIERTQADSSLRESEERLREADRRKDEFLAMLAHELRNPLAPIRNVSELLSRMLASDTKLQNLVAIITRQTNQLTRLVDDLLDVSRITRGRIELKLEDVEVGAVVAQAIETVRPLLDERKHTVSITSSHHALHVRGDFARLEQCAVNVLTNAAKYTDTGGEIRIRVWGDARDAVIEVTDNGAGIPAELLPNVFDLFVQSDRTLDRSQGGLGIGLCVVKRLIEMHGGSITARSDGAGRGSSFEIRLPTIAQAVRPAAVPGLTKASSRRILVVDDNQDAANSLALLLESDGHAVRAVYCAQAALDVLAEFRPEIALLDIGLPDMDGYTLASRIRAVTDHSGVQLVALTGYGQAEDLVRSERAGFDAHLVKPLDFALLGQTLLRLAVAQC